MAEKSETAKSEAAKTEAAKTEAAKTEAAKTGAGKTEAAKSETASIESTLDELRRDMEALKVDFTRLMDTLEQTARHGMKGAASEAEVTAGEVSDWAEAQYFALRESIRAQPLTACAIAAGMGLVFGQFLMRR